MGLLKGSSDNKDRDNHDDQVEDQYLDLYGKIARDFVSRHDLLEVLNQIMSILDPLGLSPIDFDNTVRAKQAGLLYKKLRDSGIKTNKQFKDLVDMNDDN